MGKEKESRILKTMTDEQLQELAAELLGTSKLICEAVDKLGIETEEDDDEIADRLLDLNKECCKSCGWWHESCELDNEIYGETGHCDDCAESYEW